MNAKLTVLSYNIHKGYSTAKTKYILENIRTALRKLPVDIVFLQEVAGHESQFEYLAEEIWPHHTYGKNAVRGDKHHGNALLSRYPILASENIDVSTNRFEKRSILHAQITVPGLSAPLHCLNVHFDLLHRGRKKQVQSLADRMNNIVDQKAPVLIAGDFNDWPGQLTSIMEKSLGVSELFKSTRGRHAKTFPSRFPILTLDRIYSRGFIPVESQALRKSPWNKLSDHIPVLGTFTSETPCKRP